MPEHDALPEPQSRLSSGVGGARPGVVPPPAPDVPMERFPTITPEQPTDVPMERFPNVLPEPESPPAPPYEQPPSTGLSDIAQRLLNVSSTDVDYLRGEPYNTTQEQAMRERMQSRIRNQYDQARQQLTDTLGSQQGFSGVMAGALRRLAEGEASEMSDVDRDLMIRAADEMRSRRAESRGVVGGLEALERQRMMESLGLSQAVDESERQRVIDLLNAMGVGPPITGVTGTGLLQYAGQLGQSAAQQSAANMQGISSLINVLSRIPGWWPSQQRQTAAE